MAQRLDTKVKQNMLDAGCDEQTITQAQTCLLANDQKACCRLLDAHRKQLLADIHQMKRSISTVEAAIAPRRRK